MKAALTLQIEHAALDSLLAHKARVTKAKEDLDKLDDLIDSFLLCRAVAELAERHGPAIVPNSFRRGVRFEVPAPVLGMSPSGRILASLAPNAPEAAVARAKAAEIAKALID